MATRMLLERRSVLRGLGTGAALLSPLLRSVRAEAQGPGPKNVKVAMMFMANGSHRDWAPTGNGSDFKLSECLAPLEKVRNDIIILRKLTLQRSGGNAHRGATAACLTARPAYQSGAVTTDGPSIDQFVAQQVGGTTPIRSMELSVGYRSALSEVNRSKLPALRSPVEAYARIASRIRPTGGATPAPDTKATEALLAAERSVLDSVNEDIAALRARLGGNERAKIDVYLDAIRGLERGLADLGARPAAGAGCRALTVQEIGDSAANWPKISRAHLDIIATAFACGLTRVATVVWGGGQNDSGVPWIPNMGNWHSSSHGDMNGSAGRAMIQIQQFWAGEFAYFVEKLKSLSDAGGGALFDNAIAVWGTQNGNANGVDRAGQDHPKGNTPFIVAGKAGGLWKTGQVMDCGDRNHNDFYVAVANACGIATEKFGHDPWCRGKLDGL